MSGKKHREKGDRREREIVALLEAEGIEATRVPLSGSAGGDFAGDIQLRFSPYYWGRAEVKARADGEGWKSIVKWLGDNDALFLKADRAEPLVVLPWAMFRVLLKRSQHNEHLSVPLASLGLAPDGRVFSSPLAPAVLEHDVPADL